MRFTQKILLGIFLLYALYVPYAYAQKSENPLIISADKALEWNRTEQNFTATQNAKATQGEVSIAASTLKADYRENKETGNDFDIHTMTATENVIILSEDNAAYGDKAVYDLTTEIAIMTGSDLRLTTPEQTITATDQFEYHVKDGKLIAIGNATIKRPTDTLRADTLTAFLTEDGQGKRTLDRMTASGNVIITTATEKITGQTGAYNGRTKIAELAGGVTITRGPNILQGTRATVDLNTQISRIFGNPDNGNRVTGTFYPGTTKKKGQ
jgi:lipopolysaccharide export system protein LptA